MDPYFKKEISYSLKGQRFVFDVGETLFSTFALDYGTDLLLRYITLNSPKTILDLGCGYGPIGITLARNNPEAFVTLLDRDLLAVRYAKLNINKNKVINAQAIGSVGMETVSDQNFDLIVSNIPAKIGDEAIKQEFILTPLKHLSANGELWIVIVNALNRLIPKIASQNKITIAEIKKGNGHTVYRLTN